MADNKLSMVDDIVSRERKEQLKSQLIEVGYELTMNNYETFDEILNRKLLRSQVCQSNRWRGMRRCFQMYRESHLFQCLEHTRDRKHESQQYRISLACVDPVYQHIKSVEWKWISTAVATMIWSAVLFYIAVYSPAFFEVFRDSHPQHLLSAGMLMFTISCISVLLFMYTRKDCVVFRSRQAGIPLIIMESSKPDEASFRILMNDIVKGIQQSSNDRDIQDLLVAELKELRRLRDEKVINAEDYENARQQIFSNPEYEHQSSP